MGNKSGSRRVSAPLFFATIGTATKRLVPLALGGLCVYLVSERCAAVSWEDLSGTLAGLRPEAWIMAILATAGSFWAIGQYDVTLHRHLRTGQDPIEAAHAGRAAIAIGQTVGFGLVTGALVRWKWFEPRMSFMRSGQLTLTVTVLFLISWAIVTLATLSFAGILPGPAWFWAMAASIGAFALFGLSLLQPKLGSLPLRWPSITAMTRLLGLTAIDTVLAAVALWYLLPTGTDIPFATLLPVYLLALGAALVSGTPGGVGPFEVTLLSLLPAGAEADLIAACIAFRIVYYALPAVIAAAGLARRHFVPLPSGNGAQSATRAAIKAAAELPHAEVQLHYHDTKRLLWCAQTGTGWTSAATEQALIAFFDPLCAGRYPKAALAVLETTARAHDLRPYLYKCDARMAATARAAGYRVRAVAQDALLCPVSFDLSARGCRQSRRKLRKAAQAGVGISEATSALPLTEMAILSDDWAARHGGERGFSMSRFDDAPFREQRVFLAEQDERLIGFVSFHVTRSGWALDLMRASADAPDGTMHSLILGALDVARETCCTRFSLAAVPVDDRVFGQSGLLSLGERALKTLLDRAGGAGLRQFKSSFDPRWETRYIAAPGPLSLLLGTWDIVRHVHADADSTRSSEPVSPDHIAPAASPVRLAENRTPL